MLRSAHTSSVSNIFRMLPKSQLNCARGPISAIASS
jgi:hypothetical protein